MHDVVFENKRLKWATDGFGNVLWNEGNISLNGWCNFIEKK